MHYPHIWFAFSLSTTDYEWEGSIIVWCGAARYRLFVTPSPFTHLCSRLFFDKNRPPGCTGNWGTLKYDGFVKSLFLGHCEERSDAAIS